MQVNICKAKLTDLVKQLETEGEIILTLNGKPVAKLVPYGERPFGSLKGKCDVPENIDDVNDELAEEFGV